MSSNWTVKSYWLFHHQSIKLSFSQTLFRRHHLGSCSSFSSLWQLVHQRKFTSFQYCVCVRHCAVLCINRLSRPKKVTKSQHSETKVHFLYCFPFLKNAFRLFPLSLIFLQKRGLLHYSNPFSGSACLGVQRTDGIWGSKIWQEIFSQNMGFITVKFVKFIISEGYQRFVLGYFLVTVLSKTLPEKNFEGHFWPLLEKFKLPYENLG